MEKAIEIAIANGYVNQALVTARRYDVDFHKLTGEQVVKYTRLVSDTLNNAALVDPAFWSALGKGLRWKEVLVNEDNIEFWQHGWKYEWHRFINHLSEGGDINSFFEELIK